MSDKARSVEEIEAEIQRTRLAMQSTVNELSDRLDPRTQAKKAAAKASDEASKMGEVVVAEVKAASKGDPKAIAHVASVASLVGAVIAIVALRK